MTSRLLEEFHALKRNLLCNRISLKGATEALVFLSYFQPVDWAACVLLCSLLMFIGISDALTFRIPNPASLGLMAVGLCYSLVSILVTPVDAALGALFGYAIFAIVGEVYFRRTGTDGLGLGDAKLLGAAGAWLGWAALPSLVLSASLAAIAYALLTKKRKVAFGLWLAMATCWNWISRAFL